MGTLDWLSDNLIELRGPVDIATDTAFGIGSTTTAKLYDTALDCRVGAFQTVLTADALISATSVFVQDETPLFIANVILIQLDDGTETSRSITGQPGSGEQSFTGGLEAAASKGNTVTVTQWSTSHSQINLDNFDGWETNMNMEITTNTPTLVERTVSLIDADSGYLTLSSNLGVATNVGNLVKRKIGADITLSNFGTFPTSDPVIGDPAWGFRGIIENTHADIALGMRIRGEITSVDATSGTNLTRKAVSTVINR